MTTAYKPPITISSDTLTKFQQYHALAITWLPSLGFVSALIMASLMGIGTSEVMLFIVLSFLTTLGVEVGFHRYFSHTAFKAAPMIRIALAVWGTWSAQGPIIYWVANHRRHHQHSDQPDDLHSPHYQHQQFLNPLQGLWHAHIGWMFTHHITNTTVFAKDLLQDPIIAKINKFYFQILILGLILPAVINGLWTQSLYGMLSGFLWGGLARIFWVQQFTFAVNSLCHIYGARPFKANDRSTNNFWLAIPTIGGSWHNNHHAFPHSAITGLYWWQIDLGGWFIRSLEALGFAWDVKAPSAKMLEMKRKPQTTP